MAKKTTISKNIIICCDGTGNKPSDGEASNVYDLVGLLNGTKNQLVYYDTGLGTEAAPGKQTKIASIINIGAGLAFGEGLNKNIKDGYQFLMSNYNEGDRIYIFGFSRGAYTARAIAGLIQLLGLLKPGSQNMVDYVVKQYTRTGAIRWKDIKSLQSRLCRQVGENQASYQIPIEFMGIWDTVKSVGIRRHSTRLAYTRGLPNIKTIRNAIALDEKRSKYRPNHIRAYGKLNGSVQTMWFKGAHSDVGGGYPEMERGLSDHSMKWVLEEAKKCGLVFDDLHLEQFTNDRMKLAIRETEGDKALAEQIYYQLHNPLKLTKYVIGWWVLGWLKRELPERIWIHKTAIEHFAQSKVNWTLNPAKLNAALGDKNACLVGNVMLVKFNEHLLIQKLTLQEMTYIKTLPDDPIQARKVVLAASIKCWQAALDVEIEAKNIEAKETSIAKARNLLLAAEIAIEADQFKTKGGAFDSLAAFFRMRSLKDNDWEKQSLLNITATAPYITETLAEIEI